MLDVDDYDIVAMEEAEFLGGTEADYAAAEIISEDSDDGNNVGGVGKGQGPGKGKAIGKGPGKVKGLGKDPGDGAEKGKKALARIVRRISPSPLCCALCCIPTGTSQVLLYRDTMMVSRAPLGVLTVRRCVRAGCGQGGRLFIPRSEVHCDAGRRAAVD